MRISSARAEARRPGAGFTLFEMLVAAGLSGFLLTGVLATTVQLARNGVRISHYAEMDAQVQRALEQLGHDLKAASAFAWNSASDITLTVPQSDGSSAQRTYAWSATSNTFYSVPGASSSGTTGRVVLVSGVPRRADGGAGVTFARYNRGGASATTDAATKRVQVTLTVVRTTATVATSTSTVAATFMLRNKPST